MSQQIRKCAFTDRPISPQDNASVLYTIGTLDDTGRYTGEKKIVSVSGRVRKDGLADKLLYANAEKLTQ
ncbi:small subunit ribosomal protein S21e [Nematocida sp. AWRm80]|nr:small subunit ribosomal protein S21e [Nematocida sp. AWRm80]